MYSRDIRWWEANKAMPFFAATALVMVIGATAIAMLCGAAIAPPPGESCAQCAREWTGSLSGWFAVLAAIVTVLTIRRQIEAAREDSLRVAEQTKVVVDETLNDILRGVELGWRYLDCYDDPEITEENKEKILRVARPAISVGIKTRDMAEMEEALPYLLPLDRTRLQAVLRSLRWLHSETRSKPDSDDEASSTFDDHRVDDVDKISLLRIQLAHMAKNVERYSKSLRSIFDARTHLPVNDDPYWKIATKPVEEKIEDWRKRPESNPSSSS